MKKSFEIGLFGILCMLFLTGCENENAGVRVLLLVPIAIVIFFIIRELNCWYFKTNVILHSLEELKKSIEKGEKEEGEEKQEEQAERYKKAAEQEDEDAKEALKKLGR